MENIKGDIKYGDFLYKWICYHKQFIKQSTYANYLTCIQNHILPTLGDERLKNITNNILQDYALKKLSHGSLKGGKLSQKSVKDILVVIKLSLRYAIKKRIIHSFDMSVKFPKLTEDKKLKVLSLDEQKIVTTYLLNNKTDKNIGLLLSLFCGIRIGELCALKWADVDVKNRCINIDKTLQRLCIKGQKSKIIITKPKTNKSIRKLPIPKFLLCEFKRCDKENFIITGTKKPSEPRTFRAYYERLMIKLGVEFKNFHSLRHTFATRCVELEIDYKTISELLGHASVNTTLNLYVHPNFKPILKNLRLFYGCAKD